VACFLVLLEMRSLIILGNRIKHINFYPPPQDKPILIISNHQSMWDLPPVLWFFRKRHTRFIAKKELAKYIPSISFYLKHGSSITIDRNDPQEAVILIAEQAKIVAKENGAMAIYPEGTRSKDGKVQAFKITGITKVIELIPDAVIIPIAVKNTGKIDNRGRFGLGVGIKVEITMLESRHINSDSIEQEIEKIREEIKEIVEG